MIKKEKILMSLVVIVMIALVFGSISSFATDVTANTTKNTITITASSTNNTTNNTNLSATNNTANITSIVSSANNTTNNTNTTTYEATNSSKLPYAGTTSSSIVFITIAFIASAIYAYKKVTEYNV